MDNVSTRRYAVMFLLIAGLNVSVSALAAGNSCIRFGGKSVSGKFESSGVIYRIKDGYKVIYDGDDLKLTGGAVATGVEIDTHIECQGFVGKVYSSDLSPSNLSSGTKVSGSIPVFYPSGLCPTQSIKIRIMKPKCQTCEELVEKESVSVLGTDLYWLEVADETRGLPCQKGQNTTSLTAGKSGSAKHLADKNPAVSDKTVKQIPVEQKNFIPSTTDVLKTDQAD